MRYILIILIRAYRYVMSPLIGGHCRFYPTCSCYVEEALTRFGALRGTWLGVCRLLKCHPWHTGGVDLIPEETLNKPVSRNG